MKLLQCSSNIGLLFINLTNIQMDKRTFLRKINNCINNMGTPKVYHPKRMKPKWLSLTTNKEKMEALEGWIMSKKPSLGFKRLVNSGLAEKTLESIIIQNKECERFFSESNVRKHCIDKFMLFKKGKEYLISIGIV